MLSYDDDWDAQEAARMLVQWMSRHTRWWSSICVMFWFMFAIEKEQ